ncbi:MAG: bifunctional 5,10-methylenetetrahydrofolate dehydrogenase/5,10-methenyltetrahydrofolate cyclohydrolase [Candidatus Cloacimonetes bacterium]|nr:bifunctional 5,10-methylenetetrahydrofolate dehydrogenase/5,10-methenyltetrahydrofolate cyclohydrolase [Candidatus Cloacimonadota bacterium]
MSERLAARPLVIDMLHQISAATSILPEKPKLVIIQAGKDPAADYYIDNLRRKGEQVGIVTELKQYNQNLSPSGLFHELSILNRDTGVHGIMVQKPLPAAISEYEVSMAIDPAKDVDGFHPFNLGNLMLGKKAMLPGTAAAVLELLNYYHIDTSGKNTVILGRSNNVGKPLMNLLLQKNGTGNATVTVCHSYTKNITDLTRRAEIIIAAIGKPLFLTAEMISAGVVIIDVGINQIRHPTRGEIYVGDVDYEGCFSKAAAISPVPGGVGSVTTATLLRNVLQAYKNRKQ